MSFLCVKEQRLLIFDNEVVAESNERRNNFSKERNIYIYIKVLNIQNVLKYISICKTLNFHKVWNEVLNVSCKSNPVSNKLKGERESTVCDTES